MYKIYELKKYNIKQENIKNITSNNINDITEIISLNNKGYHLKLFDNENYVIFGDIDHIEKHKIFKLILEKLAIYFNIDANNINYTKSKKENEFSYHWSISTLYSTLQNIKQIMKEFKNKYVEIEKYIDLSVYNNNKWFRLPYQTNKDKPFQHIIKKGSIKNFVLNYINEAKEYNFIKEEIKQKIKQEIKQEIKIEHQTIKENNSELENIKRYFYFLSIDRVNNYNDWYKLGCLIKSLYYEDGIILFLELSKKSKYYENDEYIINVYNNIKHLNYTINTFYFLLKHDNPKEYYKFVKNNFKKLDEVTIEKIIINSEYLCELDDNLNLSTILNENINNFFNSYIKTLSIKSPYDTGKTQLLKKIIRKYEPTKILMLSYRITLSQDLTGNFKDEFNFKNYMEDKNYKKSDRIIIQLESLLKLRTELIFIDEEEINFDVPSYNLIIIDEIESILNHFSSPTFKGDNKETFQFLIEIINNSNKLICLDGDTNERAYNFIKNFGKSINIENEYKKNIKTFNIIDNYKEFDKYLFNSLENNEKIVIVSQSKTKAEEYYQLIKEYNNKLKILLYTSLTNDEDKMKLKDVNEIWLNSDVLIYSPTIEAGVNFDKLHFNKIYGIFSNNSTSPRSFLQMLARIRKTTDNEIIINNSIDFKLNECELFHFSEVKNNLSYLKCFEKTGTYVKKNDGKKIYKISFDTYTTNFIYNYTEILNKQHYYFLRTFEQLIKNKGHKLIFNKLLDDDDEMINFKYDKIINSKEIILNADNINKEEYDKINYKKQTNQATEDDKIKAIKYFLKNQLGKDNFINKLTLDDIEKWKDKLYIIKNYFYIEDITKFKINNSVDNKIAYEKLILIKKLIDTLNLKIDNKKSFLNSNELIKKFNLFYENENIEQNKKAFKMFLKIDISIINNKNNNKLILGSINSVLSNYSLKIESKQIKKNKLREYKYFLISDNEIKDIINRKLKLKLNSEIKKFNFKIETEPINNKIIEKINEDIDTFNIKINTNIENTLNIINNLKFGKIKPQLKEYMIHELINKQKLKL